MFDESSVMKIRRAGTGLGLAIAGVLLATTASALPRQYPDPAALMGAGEPVTSIPTADSLSGFALLDDAHVMLSSRDKHYLVTLNRDCVGLRVARQVGVTASDNTIWVGFDAVTADNQACPIQAIHLVPADRGGDL